jgi:peptidoglycan/xylan/chitin deacetylase (PgdA/CDA1 family)
VLKPVIKILLLTIISFVGGIFYAVLSNTFGTEHTNEISLAQGTNTQEVIDTLSLDFATSSLAKVLDNRYLTQFIEADPIWTADKPNYITANLVDELLNDYASDDHKHDDRYYKESEVDDLLDNKSDSGHTHDSRYYTESEVDTNILAGKTLGSYSTLLPIQRNYARIDQMETDWADFYGGDGEVSFDTTDYISGTGSLKVLVNSNASNSGARTYVDPAEDWSNKFIKIYVKSNDWDNLQEVRLRISTEDQFVSYYQINLRTLLTFPGDHNNEWVEFIVPTSSFTTEGTPDWTTVNQLIVLGKGVNGEAPTLWFDEYALIARASDSMLSITFDDAHSSDYVEAREVMETYGYKGTIFVVPELIDTTGRLTQTQVDALHNEGWEISGHGNTNLTTLTTTEVEEDLKTTKNYLMTYGYRGGEIYAYPNGAHNSTIRALVQKYFSLARTIASHSQPITYMNPLMLHSKIVHDYDSVATVEGWITDAVNNNEWLILTFHRIVDETPGSATEYAKDDLQEIIDHAYTSGIEVLPMAQAVKRMQSF